jgi:predicted enzyme related to lactoylglutathione lyase
MGRELLGPLSWNLVFVDDLTSSRAFYEDVLGLRVRDSSSSFVSFHTGGCTLELMARMDNGPVAPNTARGWEKGRVLMSFKVENMVGVVAEIQRRGGKLVHGPAATVPADGEEPAGLVAQFEDPEGNLVEICDEILYP